MRLWRGVKCCPTRCTHRITASTSTVTPLRKTTAVATSTPLLKARRAATWLAPIISAISSKVAKARPLRARGLFMGVCFRLRVASQAIIDCTPVPL